LAKGRSFRTTKLTPPSKPDVWITRYHTDAPWLISVQKAIALPTQSITVEKDAKAPTTKRKLTFTDLVSHLKHHNSNVKKGIFTDSPVF
jgi:hypothetical protein